MKTDNSTATSFVHSTIRTKRSKSWDMRYHWLRQEAVRKVLDIFWDKGKNNVDEFEWNDIITGYVPHGLNHNVYKPLSDSDDLYQKSLKNIKEASNVDFIVFWIIEIYEENSLAI